MREHERQIASSLPLYFCCLMDRCIRPRRRRARPDPRKDSGKSTRNRSRLGPRSKADSRARRRSAFRRSASSKRAGTSPVDRRKASSACACKMGKRTLRGSPIRPAEEGTAPGVLGPRMASALTRPRIQGSQRERPAFGQRSPPISEEASARAGRRELAEDLALPVLLHLGWAASSRVAVTSWPAPSLGRAPARRRRSRRHRVPALSPGEREQPAPESDRTVWVASTSGAVPRRCRPSGRRIDARDPSHGGSGRRLEYRGGPLRLACRVPLRLSRRGRGDASSRLQRRTGSR